MKKAFVCATLVFNVFVGAQVCLAQDRTFTAEVRTQTIDSLSALLSERYAYRETGQKLRDLLQSNLNAGKYDRYDSPEDFSTAVTNDLRSLNSDRHLALSYNPQFETGVRTTNLSRAARSPEEQAKTASAFNRQMNYGFKNLQFFNGNIGYLKFDYFDAYLDYSSSLVDASMSFFQNCDALIIDLRDNGGGGSQMVGHIASFFFNEKTFSGTSYNRLTNETTEEFITPQTKEKQLPPMDLYILTSASTISAAEALAYTLKYMKGAKVVGETSAGAANPGRVTRLNNFFTAFIPNRYVKNAVTGSNWEGTGVPVDLACPAKDALLIARMEALKTLGQRTSDTLQQRKFNSYLTFIKNSKNEKELAERTLRQYIGEYQGGRSISVEGGKLYYSRVAEVGGQLHLISRDVFMLSEGDVTVTFRRNRQNRIVLLEYQWALVKLPSTATKLK